MESRLQALYARAEADQNSDNYIAAGGNGDIYNNFHVVHDKATMTNMPERRPVKAEYSVERELPQPPPQLQGARRKTRGADLEMLEVFGGNQFRVDEEEPNEHLNGFRITPEINERAYPNEHGIAKRDTSSKMEEKRKVPKEKILQLSFR